MIRDLKNPRCLWPCLLIAWIGIQFHQLRNQHARFFFPGKTWWLLRKGVWDFTGISKDGMRFVFFNVGLQLQRHIVFFIFAVKSLPFGNFSWDTVIYLSLSYTTWRSRALSSKSLHVFTTMSMYCLMSQRLRTMGINSRRHVACLNGYKTNCPQPLVTLDSHHRCGQKASFLSCKRLLGHQGEIFGSPCVMPTLPMHRSSKARAVRIWKHFHKLPELLQV